MTLRPPSTGTNQPKKHVQFTDSTLFRDDLKNLLDRLEQTLKDTTIPDITPFVQPLQLYIQQFRKNNDYDAFKANCHFILGRPAFIELTQTPLTLKESILHALTYVFRSFFRLFDLMLTAITQAPQTMAETPGRTSFFQYPERLSTQALKLSETFKRSLEELDDLLHHAPEKAPNSPQC